MLVLFIIGLVLILIGLLVSAFTDAKQDDFMIGFLVSFLLSMGVAVAGASGVEMWDKKPDAIDVYRNKTELQVTYKIKGIDTLSRDTVVVFKN